MLKKFILMFCLFGVEILPAQTEISDTPSLEISLPLSILKLGKPPEGKPPIIQTELATENAEAKRLTLTGLQHLIGGWEIEASRHFCYAIKEDPNCLLAHWGLSIAISSQVPELALYSDNIDLRLLDLLQAEQGSEIEQGLAYAFSKHMAEGTIAAADAYRKVANRFPEDRVLQTISAIIARGGYNLMGEATPNQQVAEKKLRTLIAADPEDPIALHAFLSIHSEAKADEESLEMARTLCRLVPDYPPYFHILGHYEWSSGQHRRAAVAFGRAASLYQNWMRETKVSAIDCPKWTLVEAYRLVALSTQGEKENALASAEKIRSIALDPKRSASAGTRHLLWYGQTAVASILMRNAELADIEQALKSLPKSSDLEPFHKDSLAHWWIDGLRLVLESHRLLESGELTQAKQGLEAVNYHGNQMIKMGSLASRLNEYSNWARAKTDLETLALQLHGDIAMASGKSRERSAFNWYRAAADSQTRASNIEPPRVLTPMLEKLGQYHESQNEMKKAREIYLKALEQFPNDFSILKRLKAIR